MSFRYRKSELLNYLRRGIASVMLLQLAVSAPLMAQQTGDTNTTTPIKHVIVIIGENRSFDHVFATYVPTHGQKVHNLLSEGIIQLDANKNAIQGPNWKQGHQTAASDAGAAPKSNTSATSSYERRRAAWS